MKQTAVIILDYRNPRATLQCLQGLLRHNTAPVRIVVVENDAQASPDPELAALMAANGVSYLPLASNLGYARGNNEALRMLEADDEVDRVLVLNNDIVITCDMLPALISAADTLPSAAIVSPLLRRPDGVELDYNCARRAPSVRALTVKNLLHPWRSLLGVPPLTTERLQMLRGCGSLPTAPFEIELPSGSCMLIGKELFRSLGYFDPDTFLYYEENILHAKTSRAGLRNYLVPSVSCIHLGGATIKAMPDGRRMMAHSLDAESLYVKRYSGASASMRALHRLSVAMLRLVYRL